MEASALGKQLGARDEPCPYCGRTLYRFGPLAPGVLGVEAGGPNLQNDERSHFKTCAHCGRRVTLELVPGSLGVGLRVATNRASRPCPKAWTCT